MIFGSGCCISWIAKYIKSLLRVLLYLEDHPVFNSRASITSDLFPWLSIVSISSGLNSESPITIPLLLIKVTLEFEAIANLSAIISAS